MSFDPSKAKTLQELYEMEENYYKLLPKEKRSQQNFGYSSTIPYSNQRLSNQQNEISAEMSKYGSNLIPDLATCGALGCLCLTGYVVNKFKPKNQPVVRQLPEVIDLTGDDDPSEEFLYENITVKQEPR